MVQRVKDFLTPFTRRGEPVSLRSVANSLDLSVSTVWRVIRKKLGWYPYRPRCVVPLSDPQKVTRTEFCNWLLQKPPGFEDSVMWSDEKWFTLNQAPNKQNERHWAPYNPGVEVACRVQGDQKVMCWAGVFKGTILIHWFNPGVSVNGDTYLECTFLTQNGET